MRILELFGGIGACSKALERLGIDYEIADYVEIDKYAVKSFNAMHNTNFEPQDICEWDKDIECDLIMHGSPCQDFSIAGRGLGGDYGSGTRSSLMYETIRIINKLRPKYIIWENVKNIISKRHKHNFDAYITQLRLLGYQSYYQVLNAKDYEIPQNRERVFVVSIRSDVNSYGCHVFNYNFPEKRDLKIYLNDLLEVNVDKKYYVSDNLLKYYQRKIEQGWRKEMTINPDISSTICNHSRNQINDTFIKPKVLFGIGEKDSNNGKQWKQQNRVYDSNLAISVCTSFNPYYLDKKCEIRKLTPKECWRLMGFDDEDFEKASKVNSDTQLYKQAGNSIVVNVLYYILKELLKRELKGENNE